MKNTGRLRKILRRRKIKRPTLLKKPEENPIISPQEGNDWEAWQTFNPGAILLENSVHFLYRAIGGDGISRFGYAISNDGFGIDERLPYPVYQHTTSPSVFTIYSYTSGGGWGGCEDPRIVRVGEDERLQMTYTASDEGLRITLTSISLDDFLNRRWRWRTPLFLSPPGEIHKNWVIFPEKIHGKYAILHSINPEISIAYFDSLAFDKDTHIDSYYGGEMRTNTWDSWVRGAGPPPIKTKYGWLLFYHAIDARDPGNYKVGAMLLDLDEPTHILHRSKQPILEPSEYYETYGFKPGIVYASGAVVKDGKLLIYYGGADNYVCAAYANLDEFLEALIKEMKPRLKRKLLKKQRQG